SFGQTFKVTPIQMITAVAAAVNGGKLMQPYVVQQVLDSDNNVIETTEPIVKRQVISEETSALMRDMMEGVVAEPDGSGKSAYIPGYRIGGKTGTSEKLDLYDENGVRITEFGLSFVGVAPIDKPQIAVYVMLDEPTTVGYGSVIAAPIVQGILKDVLPYMGIQPQFTDEELAKIDIAVPNVMGKITHGAQSEITIAGLNPRVIGTGSSVLKQIPQGGEKMPRGGTVILYTELSEDTMVEVPDVIGMSAQMANKTIINAGFNIKISGEAIDQTTDRVKSQSPEAGKSVEAGTVITISFTDSDMEVPSVPTLIAPGTTPPSMAHQDETGSNSSNSQDDGLMVSGIKPKDKDNLKTEKKAEEKTDKKKSSGTFNGTVSDQR
ncbi:MAG: penicillin-binding transpeptidase domain-containing protein, partial [Oscillospiraceae bacterium]